MSLVGRDLHKMLPALQPVLEELAMHEVWMLTQAANGLNFSIVTSSADPGAAMRLFLATMAVVLLPKALGLALEIKRTRRARELFVGYPPSSPCIGMFKDGKLVFMLERWQIEGRSAPEIAADLTRTFETHCAAGAARG